MTSPVDIANQALGLAGARSTISSFSEDSNEARAVARYYEPLRDELLRKAPWNCAFNFGVLGLLKSSPGTPEFTGTVPTVWNKSLPPPPWSYEYLYPADCLDAVWIVPQSEANVPGTPIFPISSGLVVTPFFSGAPIPFKIVIDQDNNGNDIRVILTNQSQAILAYVKRVTDPNVWDPIFIQGFVNLLGARLTFNLSGDKGLANLLLGTTNDKIMDARGGDGNEGLTINDVVPDWIRVRGWTQIPTPPGPGFAWDWGQTYALYT